MAKPGTTAPQNGTGSGAAVPPPGTEAKPGEETKDGDKADEAKNGEATKPERGRRRAGRRHAQARRRRAQARRGEARRRDADQADEAAAGPGGDRRRAVRAPPPRPPSAAAATPSAPRRRGPPRRRREPPARRPARPPRRPAHAAARRGSPPRAPARADALGLAAAAHARGRPAPDGRRRRPLAGRLAAIVGAVVGVVAVLAVAGILIFGGGGDEPAPKPNTVAQPATDDTAAADGAATPSKAPAKVNRKAVPLAVLNGTTVTGLARGAADKLTQKGYNEPNVVTNDTTNQAPQDSQVFYEGKARAAALDVAKILGVPTTQVKPMDANARALADRAQVAVFVGADKAQ